VPNAKMLNTLREGVRRFLNPIAFEDSPGVASSFPLPLPGTNSNPQIPSMANEVLAGSVIPSDIDGESVLSGSREPSLPEMLFMQPQQTPARAPLANSPSQFFGDTS